MTTKAQRQLRLRDLADLIEQVDTRFDYNHWCGIRYPGVRGVSGVGMTVSDLLHIQSIDEGGCNTVGCVAGWGAVMALDMGFKPKHYKDMTVAQYAAQFLGLKGWEQDPVFLGNAMIDAGLYPPETDNEEIRNKATPVEVAKMLRMVADGEVQLS